MKVLLYQQNQKMLKASGIGRALRHQEQALKSNGMEVTFNPNDTFDVAHINTLFKASYRFLKKCKKNNIPVVVHGHSTIEDFKESFRLYKVIEPWFDSCMLKCYRSAPIMITPTPYSKELISSYEGVNCPIYDISNGIIASDYQYDQHNVDEFRKYFNLKPTDKVVIGVGLLFKRKGLHDFIEVAKHFKDVKFIWFGHLTRIATSTAILKAIKNKPDNVIMPGYIAGSIIKGAYASANLMFFPSYEETEGIVVLEALAAKLPLLIRDIPVYKPWLKNNVNCYMGKDNNEFIELISKMLLEKDQTIIEKGYQVVVERDLTLIGQKLIKVYQEAIQIAKAK